MPELLAVFSEYPFMQNALAAAFLASLACGLVGTLVVCNRLTFLAGGASHAAYGGIGLALYFSWPPLLCVLAFSLAASLCMGCMALREGRESAGTDTAIGVLWAAGMAFGVILIELSPGYTGELMGFLFGSILTVPLTDLWGMLLFDVLLVLLVAVFYQGLWAVSLDNEFARARGLPVRFLFLLMVGLTALAVVMLIRIVGLILVLALLTIPPALARRFCRSLWGTMLLASGLSFVFCVSGLALSWYTDISSGAAIIAVATVVYALCGLGKKVCS